MLARLLLALLVLAFATPAAAAACHARASAGQHAAAEHRAPAPTHDEAAPADACVGCVPPSNWIAPRVVGPILAPAAAPEMRVAALSFGRETPPALPPPRIG